jgi:hypothetical protein
VRSSGGGRRISSKWDFVRGPDGLERDAVDGTNNDGGIVPEVGCGVVMEVAEWAKAACGGLRVLRIGCSTALARGQLPSGGGEGGVGRKTCGRAMEECKCAGYKEDDAGTDDLMMLARVSKCLGGAAAGMGGTGRTAGGLEGR